MRIQGSTALCGLCALNNAYQVNVLDNVMLNQLVDELWIKHYTELEMPMTEKYTPLRDENGLQHLLRNNCFFNQYLDNAYNTLNYSLIYLFYHHY